MDEEDTGGGECALVDEDLPWLSPKVADMDVSPLERAEPHFDWSLRSALKDERAE